MLDLCGFDFSDGDLRVFSLLLKNLAQAILLISINLLTRSIFFNFFVLLLYGNSLTFSVCSRVNFSFFVFISAVTVTAFPFEPDTQTVSAVNA
jgi:hypothetical protein